MTEAEEKPVSRIDEILPLILFAGQQNRHRIYCFALRIIMTNQG